MLSSRKSDASAVTPEISALIRARLDAFVQAGQGSGELSAELAAVCGKYPGASWEVLALIDQYHRRGHLSIETFRAVKAETHKLIFGPPHADETPELRIPSDTRAPDPEPPTPPERDRAGPARAESTRAFAPRGDNGSVHEPRPEPSPAVLAPGTVLRDRYVIQAPLGRGGMGTIFKALDRHRLNLPPADRHVAIKVLRDEFNAKTEAVAALQDEFCLAQSLSHPNIINVFDLDHDGDRHFITMELLDGELLNEMTSRMYPHLLPLAQAFRIIQEVGIALQYAHERGVVHADLKPGNIMITRTGRVCVLDFGVASRTPSDAVAAGPARRPTFQAATPEYASRERRLKWEPDPRDDIYSLAYIAYELLSGRRPFSEPRIEAAHPDRIRLRRVRGLTGRQWRTLQWGMAPDRERRPRTVREWLDSLELHRAAENRRPRRAMSVGPRRPASSSIGFGMVVIVSVVAFLAMSKTGPFRDLPLAVAARKFVSEVVTPAIDREVAANRSNAGAMSGSAPSEATAGSERGGPVEQPVLSESPVVSATEGSAATGEVPASRRGAAPRRRFRPTHPTSRPRRAKPGRRSCVVRECCSSLRTATASAKAIRSSA